MALISLSSSSSASSTSSSCAPESKSTEDIVTTAVSTDLDDLLPDLKNMVFDYMNSTPLYGPNFFSNLSKPYEAQARLAASYLVNGRKAKADELVDDNPAILSVVIEMTDRLGNRAKGTLLQLAAMHGSFNLHETKMPNKDYGLVERWRRHLPAAEALRQLEAIGPLSWSAERMQEVKGAITDFLTEISCARATTYDALKIELATSIDKFRRAFRPDPNSVITKGYIFDPQVLPTAVELLEKNIDSLGGWLSNKADIFAVLGFGFLQRCASIEDLKVLKKGVFHVFGLGQTPDDSVSFVPGVSNSLSKLGESSFLNEFGNASVVARDALRVEFCDVGFCTKLCTKKNSRVAMCYAAIRQSCQEELVHSSVAFCQSPATIPACG